MPLDWVTIIIGLVGGLALFLYGLEQMSDGLQLVAGSTLKNLLGRLTRNRFLGAVAGAVVTAVIQSSSVTTVLVVGFISAGLMTMQQSIAVVMGANVGTTLTAQVIAFKITQYALIPIAIGFVLEFFGRRDRIRFWGQVIMGLGLLFFGMHIMSEATYPLRSYQPFIDWMARMESPWLGIAVSAIFTGLIQSSAATTGVVIALAGAGLVTIEAGIAIVFGANIGTCVTAMLASIGKPREAVQAAVAHVIFNVAGVLVWLTFIHELAEITRFISPSAPSLSGVERLAAEVPRQVANAHTVFNVANMLIFIWLSTPLAWLIQKLIPVRKGDEDLGKPQYLDPVLLSSPDLALDRSRRELGRMGEFVAEMVEATSGIHDRTEVEDLKTMDDAVDRLHLSIIGYLSDLSRRDLTEAQSVELSDHLLVANYFENIGDMVETNLLRSATEMLEIPLEPSPRTAELLSQLRSEVVRAVRIASRAFTADDRATAEDLVEAKEGINEIAAELEDRLASRLVAEAPHRLDAFRIESEVVEYLKRVYYFAKRIAKVILTENRS